MVVTGLAVGQWCDDHVDTRASGSSEGVTLAYSIDCFSVIYPSQLISEVRSLFLKCLLPTPHRFFTVNLSCK